MPTFSPSFLWRFFPLLSALLLAPAWAAPQVQDVPWLNLQDTRMTRQSETVFGSEVAVYEAGMHNREQVVLVHGLGQEASRIWAKTFAALAEDFHVIAVDLPGFGNSDKGNHPYAPPAYAQILKDVIAAHAEGPVILVGHSMGGAVSLSYAALAPETVRRLILIDVAGILHRSVYAGYLSRLGMDFLPGSATDQNDWLSHLAQTALGAVVDPLVPAERIFSSPALRTKLLAADPNRIAALGLALQDYTETLAQVKTPAVVLWGQADTVAPLRSGRLLAGALHPARLRVIPGADHSPMLSAEKAFHKLLVSELARSDQAFVDMNISQAYALPRQLKTSKHDVDCEDSSEELVLEGDYRHVRITACDNVTIRNAHLVSLQVEDARLVVQNSHIIGRGLRCNDSRVEITGGSISGMHAVDCEDSEIDLAGVTIRGEQTALKGSDTLVYLSVSRLHSPLGSSTAHQVLFLDKARAY